MTNVKNSLVCMNSNTEVVKPITLPEINNFTHPVFTISEPIETNVLIDNLFSFNTNTSSRLNEDFEIIEVINSGGFGLVYKAQHKLDKRIYAIKEIPIKLSPYYTKEEFNEMLQQIFSEVYLLSRLDTSYVLRYYSCWLEKTPKNSLRELKDRGDSNTDSGSLNSLISSEIRDSSRFISISLFISMELASKGTLKDFYSTEISIKTKLSMLIQITQAVSYLHKNQVAHRDLTPANIFLADNNKLKIGDFGLSTHPFFYTDTKDGVFPYKEEIQVKLKKNKSNSLRRQKKKSTSKIFGVHNVNQNNVGIDIARDCYAVGIIMIEFLVGFNTNMERILFFKKIKKYLEEEKYNLIRAMLEEHIKRRDIVDVILNLIGEMSKRRNLEWVKRKLCSVLKRNKYSNGK